MEKNSQSNLAVIFNIPRSFGAQDLRRFFTTFLEADRFSCFHYKRRPEDRLQEVTRQDLLKDDEDQQLDPGTNCALVRLQDVQDFCSFYHLRHWTAVDGTDLTSRCLAFAWPSVSSLPASSLSEFRPPAIAPKGNVGTPTVFFSEAIRQCRLSPKVIAKLGLDFGLANKRLYSAVPPSHVPAAQKESCTKVRNVNLKVSSTAEATKKIMWTKVQRLKTKWHGPKMSQEADYVEEEWDRHRALHDDVSARRMVDNLDDLADQPGTKDRLYEESMEVTWEKGGSGLVFYTDAQFWREAEAQEEAEDADDWDVDTSEYEVKGSGDMDAREAASMRFSDDLRQGQTRASAFKNVGQFERHTKGVGRRLMEGQGWKEGQGLGKLKQGRPKAVDGKGQQGRSGLGFSGKTDYRDGSFKKTHHQATTDSPFHDGVYISTIYDKKQ